MSKVIITIILAIFLLALAAVFGGGSQSLMSERVSDSKKTDSGIVSEQLTEQSQSSFGHMNLKMLEGCIMFRGVFRQLSEDGKMCIYRLDGTHPLGVIPSVGIPDDVSGDGFINDPRRAQLYDYVEVLLNQDWEMVGFRNFGNNARNARYFQVDEIRQTERGELLVCNGGEFELLVADSTVVYYGFGSLSCGEASVNDIEVGDRLFVLLNLEFADVYGGVFHSTPIEIWIGRELKGDS